MIKKEIYTVWGIGPDLCAPCAKLDLLEKNVNNLTDPALFILYQVRIIISLKGRLLTQPCQFLIRYVSVVLTGGLLMFLNVPELEIKIDKGSCPVRLISSY